MRRGWTASRHSLIYFILAAHLTASTCAQTTRPPAAAADTYLPMRCCISHTGRAVCLSLLFGCLSVTFFVLVWLGALQTCLIVKLSVDTEGPMQGAQCNKPEGICRTLHPDSSVLLSCHLLWCVHASVTLATQALITLHRHCVANLHRQGCCRHSNKGLMRSYTALRVASDIPQAVGLSAQSISWKQVTQARNPSGRPPLNHVVGKPCANYHMQTTDAAKAPGHMYALTCHRFSQSARVSVIRGDSIHCQQQRGLCYQGHPAQPMFQQRCADHHMSTAKANAATHAHPNMGVLASLYQTHASRECILLG